MTTYFISSFFIFAQNKLKMRKLRNPYTRIKDYCCFGCSPDNPDGLNMEFYEDGDEIYSEWEPKYNFQGYTNVLHGGIQSALIDEIAYWVVLIKLKTGAVTTRLDVQLRKPVLMDKGKIKLRANLVEVNRKIAHIAVKLFDSEDNLCAKASVHYFTFSVEDSIKNWNFPEDYSSFFEN